MKSTMKVRGLADLGRVLIALPRDISSRSGGPLLFAVNKAADVFIDAAKQNVRALPVSKEDSRDDYVRTGTLERSIRRKRVNKTRESTEHVIVKPRGGKGRGKNPPKGGANVAPYWDEVEFGTSKMPARPFMRPAAHSHSGRALNAFSENFGKAVKRAVKRYEKRRTGGG